MNERIYTEFLRDELNEFVANLLYKSIERGISERRLDEEIYSFNRFNVKLNFVRKIALIEDVVMYDDDDFSVSFDQLISDIKDRIP